jgi:phosphoribosylglycinamide formyltransferase-1
MERRPFSPEFETSRPLRLGFLASHNGTSMQAVLGAIQEGSLNAIPEVVISNNSRSMAMRIAETLDIPRRHISNYTHPQKVDETIAATLLEHNVDLIVCSGWMKNIEEKTLEAFSNRIINIHPAVHQEYMGDKWMDMAVHEAVIKDGKHVSGYTIHLVTNDLDKGQVLSTGFVRVTKDETSETLQQKVKHAESQGIVALLKDISNPTKKYFEVKQLDGSISLLSFTQIIRLPNVA